MKFLKSIPIFLIFFGILPLTNFVYADDKEPKDYKILLSSNKTLSINNVKAYIAEGDALIKKGDFEKAKKSFDKARDLAKKLAGYYLDLNGSFSKVDARIPKEMQKKGKDTLKVLVETNERLSGLFIRQQQPEVAVPLLVEIIRIMTPSTPEGKEAYKKLIQLGFVETPYKGL